MWRLPIHHFCALKIHTGEETKKENKISHMPLSYTAMIYFQKADGWKNKGRRSSRTLLCGALLQENQTFQKNMWVETETKARHSVKRAQKRSLSCTALLCSQNTGGERHKQMQTIQSNATLQTSPVRHSFTLVPVCTLAPALYACCSYLLALCWCSHCTIQPRKSRHAWQDRNFQLPSTKV